MAEDPTGPQFGRGPVHEVQVLHPIDVHLAFNCDTDDYATFINQVRQALAEHDNGGVVHGVPLLSKKLRVKPARWMRIKLVCDGHKVTLVIRDDNVYLEGFELETEALEKKLLYVFGIKCSSKNRRKKKKRMTARMFKDSTFLGYDHKYRSMLGDDVLSNFPRLRMGREFAREAVRLLSTYDQPRPIGEAEAYVNQTKEALAGLIFIFCEGARMDPQHSLVSGAWRSNQDASITGEHVHYCWAWGALSRLLQGLELFDRDARLLENVDISTVEGAAGVLRLALNPLVVEVPAGLGGGQDQPPPPGEGQAGQDQPPPPPPPPGGAPGEGQAGQDQPAQGNNGKAPKQGQTSGQPSSSRDIGQRGRPLVEVFSVRANFPNVGTIAIFDGRRGQIIYEGDQGQTDDSQSQGVLKNLALTGPYRGISAEEGSFAVTVEPYSGSDEDESNDDIGDKFWELKFVVPKGPSTPVIRSEITPGEGDGRKIIVSYAVLSDAVEATVEVELEMIGVEQANGEPIDVYGEITARNPMLTLLGGETVVLLRRDKASKEPVICGSIVSLPLDRSALAAAPGLELVIDAKLHASWPGNETAIDFGGEFHVSPLPDRHDVVFPVKIVSPDIYPIQEPSDGTRPSQGLWQPGEME